MFISLEDRQTDIQLARRTDRWKDISLITFIFLCTIKYTQIIFKVVTVINGEKTVQACHETGPNTSVCERERERQ